jgi:hypothetical protein
MSEVKKECSSIRDRTGRQGHGRAREQYAPVDPHHERNRDEPRVH